MKNVLEKMLFPDGIKCIACDDELAVFNESGLCPKCAIPQNKPHCVHCGRGFFRFGLFSKKPVQTEYTQKALCAECEKNETFFTRAAAPYVYINQVKHIVHKLKFSNGVYLAKYMAHGMVKTLKEQGWNVDFVTYAPLSRKRLKRRGYNQAQKLAECVGALTGLKVAGILNKVKENKPLSKLTRAQRLRQISGSIEVEKGITLNGQSVLLIDDVLTTGATAGECANRLIGAGAASVYVLTYATSRVGVEPVNEK